MQAPLSPLVDKGAFAISALLIVPYMGQQCKPYVAIEALPPLGGRGEGIFFISTRYCILFFFTIQYLVFFFFWNRTSVRIFSHVCLLFAGAACILGVWGDGMSKDETIDMLRCLAYGGISDIVQLAAALREGNASKLPLHDMDYRAIKALRVSAQGGVEVDLYDRIAAAEALRGMEDSGKTGPLYQALMASAEALRMAHLAGEDDEADEDDE